MKSIKEGLDAIKQIPFFGAFKILLCAIAVAGIVVIVSAVREGLYGKKQSNYADLSNAKVEQLTIGDKFEEKKWYWESYFEQSTGKLGDSMIGFKIGRKF